MKNRNNRKQGSAKGVTHHFLSAGALAAGVAFSMAAQAQQSADTSATKVAETAAQPAQAASSASAASNEAAPAGATLAPITVTAADDKVAEALNPPTTIGSKIPVAQREIPQSVTVITQQQLQSQNATTVDDALKYVPGVTVNTFQTDLTAYYSRGFPISTFELDGVPTVIPSSGGAMTADGLAAYDRVEVLRGPAGLFNGMGGDGGTINLVRKRAPSTFQASAQVSVGTYADRREQIDIGGPLNRAGTLRGRLVAMQQDEHLAQDGSWQRNQQLYGTLEADLTSTTLARIGISYTNLNGHVPYGLPYYADNSLFTPPRSQYLGADWDRQQVETTNAFFSVEQKLAADWTAKFAYNHTQIHAHLMNGIPGSPVDPATDTADLYSYNSLDNNTQDAIDLYATGPFSLFGRQHHLTIGASYLHQSDHYTQFFINPDTGLDDWGDIFTSVYDNAAYSNAFAGGPQEDYKTVTNQYGVYGNARFSIMDPLTLIVGGRVSWWHSERSVNADPYFNEWGFNDDNDRIGPKFTPFVGLVYDINGTYSAYASYTSIFVPQTGDYSATGKIIDPVTGSQFEVGLKGEYYGGRLNTGIALFQVTEDNRALSDPANPGYYVAQGRARSRGVELTASGEVLPGLTVGGGYTYTATQTFDDSSSVGAAFNVTTPKHLFKLWSNYQLPGSLHKWNVGGSVYASSSTYFSTGDGNVTGPGYATVDANVGYQLTKNVSASLSVTNLFDRKYFTTVAGAGGNYYGEPAKVLFTLRAKI